MPNQVNPLRPHQINGTDWCQRCVRFLYNNPDAAVAKGCDKGHTTRCDRCREGNRSCIEVPRSCQYAAGELVAAAQLLGQPNAPLTREEIINLARELHFRMQQATGATLAAIPSVGLAPGATPKRAARLGGSAGGNFMTDATGRLLVQAVRTVANIMTQMSGIDAVVWPEDEQIRIGAPLSDDDIDIGEDDGGEPAPRPRPAPVRLAPRTRGAGDEPDPGDVDEGDQAGTPVQTPSRPPARSAKKKRGPSGAPKPKTPSKRQRKDKAAVPEPPTPATPASSSLRAREVPDEYNDELDAINSDNDEDFQRALEVGRSGVARAVAWRFAGENRVGPPALNDFVGLEDLNAASRVFVRAVRRTERGFTDASAPATRAREATPEEVREGVPAQAEAVGNTGDNSTPRVDVPGSTPASRTRAAARQEAEAPAPAEDQAGEDAAARAGAAAETRATRGSKAATRGRGGKTKARGGKKGKK